LARSSAWEGLTYRPLEAPGHDAGDLLTFVGAWAPPPETVEWGWGAWSGERLVGALLMERAGAAAMLHGPVVVTPDAPAPPADVARGESDAPGLDVAGKLLDDALALATARGIETVFTRPQGLDRLWVRSGFVPVPEPQLPLPLRGRPGVGLFAWRGGSAIWSAASRGAPPGPRRRR
jgi:hypothetical protein